jgi:hypothetical protein
MDALVRLLPRLPMTKVVHWFVYEKSTLRPGDATFAAIRLPTLLRIIPFGQQHLGDLAPALWAHPPNQ